MAPMWKKLMKNVDIDEPASFLDHVYLGCSQRECKPNETNIEKTCQGVKASRNNPVAWSYDTHGRTCSKMRRTIL